MLNSSTQARSVLDEQLDKLNQRLKAGQLGVQLERRGQKLNLRATLPPRPGSPRLRPHQQRLCLNLPATAAGLKQAEQQAKIIALQLMQQSFDWRQYLPLGHGAPLHQLDLSEKLAAFQTEFLAPAPHQSPHQSPHRASRRTTWETAYAPYLRELVELAEARPALSLPEAIYATVQATRPHSRSRQICCTALSAFADFLHLDLPTPLKAHWGSYNSSHTQARRLPSDSEIVAVYEQISNPSWRFVYGVMATYGLRNHEVFFCDYSRLSGSAEPTADCAIEVLPTTKTGSHSVWPFYPEWIEQFQLRAVLLPPLTTDLSQTTLRRIGQLVNGQFRRYQIPFSPYDLRHAWAVRTIHFGLPDTVAARMMGHSVAIHNRTYHRWITNRDQQQAVTAAHSRTQMQAPAAPRNL
ncbi:MAG: site-specific integrase [Pegethrix bostrychoides GSE-TBD4-15B]|jgi:integrase|uniref:Site-specific integrase n=1 Tax=Pegethrix bostrychoides GSE-TBD4-15B TaxID=2839662 RepID=A0A951PCZ1_9CYAN|nr:site-specific integrase [Pegethrix bostrychoides GSE-TBD4-15B]